MQTGDGDGNKFADYHEKAAPPQNVEQRWRFYQARISASLTLMMVLLGKSVR